MIIFLISVLALNALFISSAAAEENWIFLYNDNVEFIDNKYAPIREENKLFFPIDFILPYFNSTYEYDIDSETLNVYMGKITIAFDISYGIVITSDNRTFYEKIITRDDKMYISINFLAQESGYILTVLPNRIVRIKTGKVNLVDTDMIRLLKSMPPESSLRGVTPTYYFAAFGVGQQTTRLLTFAGNHSQNITFFISDEDIKERPLLVCNVVASGYSFGITPSQAFLDKSPSEDEIVKEVLRIDTLLQRLIRQNATLAGLPYGSKLSTPSLSDKLLVEGFVLWTPNIIIPEEDNLLSSASTIFQLFNRYRPAIKWNCLIQIQDTFLSGTVFDLMLTGFKSSGSVVGSIYRGSKPVRQSISAYDYYTQ